MRNQGTVVVAQYNPSGASDGQIASEEKNFQREGDDEPLVSIDNPWSDDVVRCPLWHSKKVAVVLQRVLTRVWVQLGWTPSINTRTINLQTNEKGCDNSETTIVKPSARRIQICLV